MATAEEMAVEFTRRGEIDKAKWIRNIRKTILPSQEKRIREKDRSVIKELAVPKWVTWEFLYEWANSQDKNSGKQCALCSKVSENGIDFKEKFICENCFLLIKNQ